MRELLCRSLARTVLTYCIEVLTVTVAVSNGEDCTPSSSVTVPVTLSVCVKLHDVLDILPTNEQV